MSEGPVEKEGESCSRRHVWLYDADYQWIKKHVDFTSPSKFIRIAVRNAVKACQEKGYK